MGSTPEPVAVVGYACRLPGEITTPEDLWQLCTRARSGWCEVPSDRFSADAFYHPNPLKPGTFNPRGGYFLKDDITKFDAPFFNLTPAEAISLDPQQRLLLECTFEAVESAGIPKEDLAGRRVGVYVGGNFSDYELNNLRDLETAPMHQATGCAPAMQSNRISYFFDLRGPSMTFDTACSGSLVALHHAVRSLASGESSEAIVAGCRLNILPDFFVTMSMAQLTSDHGKTFAFDERADSGFARGEGAGVVILKPLQAALRDNDSIRAVIYSSGVGQDGKTLGITNPNGEAQRDLIRQVYQEAYLDPRECGFAEMHGTGTKVGDPIEATAIHEALSHLRTPQDPLYIGSVKTNVGHLEGASGVISVIKAAMMLEKRLVLPNVNFRSPNPAIPLHDWNMKVLTQTEPWPRHKKYVSISNYGFGGTNAHAVLGLPPRKSRQSPKAADEGLEDPKKKLFVVSANDKEALQLRMKDLIIYFEQRPEVFEKALCPNVAYTLGSRRSHLSNRLAISASSLDELGSKMTQTKIFAPRIRGAPKIGFVFTGQGAQWARMGMELMHEYPVFASAIIRADAYLRKLDASFSILQEIQAPKAYSRINSPEVSQPACTAIQIGLVNLLRSWNVSPSSVVGHSSGEIAAAYAAGAFDADGAMALAYHRGNLTLKLKKMYPMLKGGMLAVGLGADAVRPYLKKVQSGYVTVACINSPTSTTISGDAPALAELHAALDAEEIFNRELKIDVAYHSEHMARVSDIYLASISDRMPSLSMSAEFYSSVHSRALDAADLGPAYWIENLVSPVRFVDALSAMCSGDARPDLLIEIGPHSTLKGPIKEILKHLNIALEKTTYASTLIRGGDATEAVQEAAGAAYMKGATLDILAMNFPHTNARDCNMLTDMPRYPWQHGTSYWNESRIPLKHNSRLGKRNDILGVVAAYSNDLEPTWRNIIKLDDVPWLRHHKMQAMPVFPFAGYIAMAIEAAQQQAESQSIPFDSFEMREVMVSSALVLNDGINTETTITLRPFNDASRGNSNVWKDFRICSWKPESGWADHCRGLIRVVDSHNNESGLSGSGHKMELDYLRKREADVASHLIQKVDEAQLYEALENMGAGYGSSFRGLRDCSTGYEHSRGIIQVQDTTKSMPQQYETDLVIHPTLLDSFIQLCWPILGGGGTEFDTLYMPTMVRSINIHSSVAKAPGKNLTVWCTGSPDIAAPKATHFDFHATSTENPDRPVIRFDGLVMTPIRDSATSSASQTRQICYKLVSEPFDARSYSSTSSERNSSVSSENSIDTDVSKANGVHETNNVQTNGVHTNGVQINGSHTNGVHINGVHTNGVNTNGLQTNGGQANSVHLTNDIAHDLRAGNGHVHMNGSIEQVSNENTLDTINGTSQTNGNSQVTQSSNGFEYQQSTDIQIIQLGDNANLSEEVSELIRQSTQAYAPIAKVGDADCAGKRVIILQPGPLSLDKFSESQFSSFKQILLGAAKILWVYAKDIAESAMSVGLARTVRSENMSRIIMLGVDSTELNSTWPSQSIGPALDSFWFPVEDISIEDSEFTAQGRKLSVQKVVEDEQLNDFVQTETGSSTMQMQSYEQSDRRLKIEIGSYGALDTICFVDDHPQALGDNEVEIQVRATGVNFKDIVVCMGQVSQPYIGVECSGVISAIGRNVTHVQTGQRVMAMTEGAYSTYARCLETSVFPISDSMTFEEAATIPVVFCTAYYGLFDLGRLTEGETVLIHAAAGGVGQAAIMLAKMVGAEIFATVGSQEKKQFLMDQYGIPEERIFSSRNTSFSQGIQTATNRAGVDVVLNSLAGDLLMQSWNCLAPFGRFIEIGKADITRNSRLDMLKFEYNCTFASVDLTKVASYKPKLMRRLLADVNRVMEAQSVAPITPITTYPIADTESAFRALQTGKTMGKLVVVPNAKDQVLATRAKVSSDLLRADATYILVGGTGGLGRSMAKWMSSRGARNIVLTSRSASMNNKLEELITELATNGTRVIVHPCDVAQRASVEQLIKDGLRNMPPVRGIIHGAMVLKDVLFEQMTLEQFRDVSACKIDGVKNLHEMFADTPLEFFIALSSIAAVVGNRGQAAYASANFFLDAFMDWRRSQGLPGISIDLAAVSDVGYLADGSEARRQEVLENIGGQTIDESEVLALLSAALSGEMNDSCGGHCITGLGNASENSFWIGDGKFSQLRSNLESANGDGAQNTPTVSIIKAIQSATSPDEAFAALYSPFAAKLTAVLSMPEDAIEPSQTLKALGLDSLVAIEVRNWIARETEVNLQVLELLSSGSVSSLMQLVLKKMGCAQ